MAKKSPNTNGSKRWKLGLVKSYLLIQANNSICALVQTTFYGAPEKHSNTRGHGAEQR